MIDKPQYIIVAGINGAGKSTLYDTFPSLFDKTKRINADELLRQMGGDWHKDSDNLKAMKEEINDKVMIYDNSEKFTSVYAREKGQVFKNDLRHFPWINQNITYPEKVQKQLQNFADQNPEVKPKNDPENKNDRPSY